MTANVVSRHSGLSIVHDLHLQSLCGFRGKRGKLGVDIFAPYPDDVEKNDENDDKVDECENAQRALHHNGLRPHSTVGSHERRRLVLSGSPPEKEGLYKKALDWSHSEYIDSCDQ